MKSHTTVSIQTGFCMELVEAKKYNTLIQKMARVKDIKDIIGMLTSLIYTGDITEYGDK